MRTVLRQEQPWLSLRDTLEQTVDEIDVLLIKLRNTYAELPDGDDWLFDTPTRRHDYEGTECKEAVQDGIDRLEQALLRLQTPHRNLVKTFPEDE